MFLARDWRTRLAEMAVFIRGAPLVLARACPARMESHRGVGRGRPPLLNVAGKGMMVMTTKCWLVVALLLPRLALAQGDLPFARLADQLNAGDRVRIIDATGRVREGRVVALEPDYIALARPGGASERIAETDVREVQVRRHDGVRNGTLIGFGSVAVSYCGLALASGSALACGLPAVFLGGLGAGIGALVDAAITRRAIVFRAGARPVTVSVWPVSAGFGAGVAMRW